MYIYIYMYVYIIHIYIYVYIIYTYIIYLYIIHSMYVCLYGVYVYDTVLFRKLGYVYIYIYINMYIYIYIRHIQIHIIQSIMRTCPVSQHGSEKPCNCCWLNHPFLHINSCFHQPLHPLNLRYERSSSALDLWQSLSFPMQNFSAPMFGKPDFH